MCGITVLLARNAADGDSKPYAGPFAAPWDALLALNACRGPDLQLTRSVSLGGGHILTLAASVLHLRGKAPYAQPHISDRGDILCWNGEIFEGMEISPTENDGAKLFTALSATSSSAEVVETLAKLEGPYAFVFYSASEVALYFGRDPLGRRSLLIQYSTPALPVFALSSTSAGHVATPDLEELSTKHLFRLDLSELWDLPSTLSNFLAPVPRAGLVDEKFCLIPTINRTISTLNLPVAAMTPMADDFMQTVSEFIAILDSSVRLRVQDVPPLPTPRPTEGLGPDNGPPSRVAVLFSGGIDSSMVALLADRHVPPDEPIDLLNVAFENPRKLRAMQEPQQPRMQKRKKLGVPQEPIVPTYMVPDRITGLEELEELRSLRPNRQWNFVEVNVDYQECTRLRPVVEALMHPSKTIMDLSLALALYFASRGQGIIKTADGSTEQYHSRARVILSGLGSDELLGGYGRHKTAYLSGGWQALLDELQLELSRIPTRNMGRDDRIISSHGKEARYPFLSLSVVNFLAALPVHLKVDPRMGDGLGDKMLLRVAARQLGLVFASSRRKRAMQFGSQSARMEAGASRRGDVDVAPFPGD